MYMTTNKYFVRRNPNTYIRKKKSSNCFDDFSY